jgi:hypothetical protein
MHSDELARIRDWLKAQVDLWQQLNRLVEILLGNIHQEYPATLREYFQQRGIRPEEYDRMSSGEIADAFQKLQHNEPTSTDNLIAALDLLFHARYGWPEGTVKHMPIAHAYLALEHALEYDDPGKPSVWTITKA